MKTLLFLCSLLAFTGCASAPPTALEAKLFQITTNSVPTVLTVTNTVSVTNAVVQWVTNTVGEVLTLTNYVQVPVPVVTTITNVFTSYQYVPGTNAAEVVKIGTEIGTPFGVGGIAGAILGGMFGLWGMLRSSKATKTAGVLAQIIETGREILQTTPQGKEAEVAWRDWMIRNQAQAGVIEGVVKLLQKTVDSEEAKATAGQLLKIMEETNPKA